MKIVFLKKYKTNYISNEIIKKEVQILDNLKL